MTPGQLIDQLIREGGAIVSSAECSDMEIAVAQSVGRFSVDENGFGFVRRPKEWLAIVKRREELHPNDDGRYSTPA